MPAACCRRGCLLIDLLELVGPIGHTEGVIVLEQQTWVTLLGFAGFGLALMGYLASMKRDLKTEIRDAGADAKADNERLEAQVADTRTELKTDLGRLDGRLVALESRMHDIAVRLPAALTPAKPTAS